MKANYDMDPEYWETISDEAKDLVKRLLLLDYTKRLTAKEALKHPWIQVQKFIIFTANPDIYSVTTMHYKNRSCIL